MMLLGESEIEIMAIIELSDSLNGTLTLMWIAGNAICCIRS
jgi:hypothetical protein